MQYNAMEDTGMLSGAYALQVREPIVEKDVQIGNKYDILTSDEDENETEDEAGDWVVKVNTKSE